MSKALSPTRRAFFSLLVGVAAVHVIAITVYYAFDIEHAPSSSQRLFAWIWMTLTVAVVFVGLQRIKRARRASRDRSR